MYLVFSFQTEVYSREFELYLPLLPILVYFNNNTQMHNYNYTKTNVFFPWQKFTQGNLNIPSRPTSTYPMTDRMKSVMDFCLVLLLLLYCYLANPSPLFTTFVKTFLIPTTPESWQNLQKKVLFPFTFFPSFYFSHVCKWSLFIFNLLNLLNLGSRALFGIVMFFSKGWRCKKRKKLNIGGLKVFFKKD